ncbi:adenylate/guanylate cyclase domain-containing protein [Phyllobacterium myrsinacearum]|uniref:Adenylate cyclase n=1 Tax=Phyllobacterium myrsinacearum TaxID=28101 RepID=A0A839END7_9HYPH|nr:adenylate/guanylate cyclase domain-containing protein [Phyllobacterium myrsinacearum]MBA8881601.1 adenylate cyclase [Phyllobacterium myrsinacearum]
MQSLLDVNKSSPRAGGVWPAQKSALLDWLMIETREQRFIDNILVEMCERLGKAGIPVGRASLHFRIQHPQWRGARLLWRKGLAEAEIRTFEYGSEQTAEYLNSPLNDILTGAGEVRQRLEVIDAATPPYPLYDELRAEGLTDYVAWPLDHTLGKRHVVAFATDRRGGFTDEHIAALYDLMPALAIVSEIRLKNRFARTLLETYVGPHASEQILAGATTRGSGVTVGAAILICDLRDFTAISDAWPRDNVIELLNGYFDAMSEPIEKYGGEILKFMGDGLLAIFPLSNPTACVDLLRAISEAQAAMSTLNAEHVREGRKPLGYGIGVHVGDVMYGNIGSRKRLDFTVIGPAVNIASRLETLTKQVKRPVLLSKTFVDLAGCAAKLENLGSYLLRGLDEPIDVFAFSGDCLTVNDVSA